MEYNIWYDKNQFQQICTIPKLILFDQFVSPVVTAGMNRKCIDFSKNTVFYIPTHFNPKHT